MHLESGAPPFARCGGTIERLPGSVLDRGDVDRISEELLSSDARAALLRDGDASTGIDRADIGRLRAHAYAASSGICLALRLLPETVPSLEALALPSRVAEFARARHGLVIFTGPTGSGKTTSLAAFVDAINARQMRKIITIEDPVEYRLASRRSLVRQREIGRDVADYGSAIHGALRSDPDVIVIGEMRDPATIRAALTAAETGHLVAATLHTSGAAATIARLADAFPPDERPQLRGQIADVLVGVVSQRLVPCIDGGRRCVAEVLAGNDAVRAIIRDGRLHQLRNVLSTSRDEGMQTFESALGLLVSSGDITPATAVAFADVPKDLDSLAAAI